MTVCKVVTRKKVGVKKVLSRKTAKHPQGMVFASRCKAGKVLQKMDAVKAWRQALKEKHDFTTKEGKVRLIPKKGTKAYNKIKKRMQELM
jgi:hypothetical protein